MDKTNDNIDKLKNEKKKYKKMIFNNKVKIFSSVLLLALSIPASKYILYGFSNNPDVLRSFMNQDILTSDLFSIATACSVFPLTSLYRISKYIENKTLKLKIKSIDEEINDLEYQDNDNDKSYEFNKSDVVDDKVKDNSFDRLNIKDEIDVKTYDNGKTYGKPKAKKLVRKNNFKK